MDLTLTDMPLTAAHPLTITGVPKLDAKRFFINIGCGHENIALHFDARFEYLGDHRTIVLNTMHNGTFSTEKKEKHFFFQERKEFKVKISFNNDEFQVIIPDDFIITFPNSFDKDEFKFIRVNGDIRIKSFNIE